MELSVIVSTRNRANDLANLLESLEQQDIAGAVKWEVVVSNNASTDRTEEVLQKAFSASDIPLRYIRQSYNAKSFGLNAAIESASGKLLALTDDDVIVPKCWVRRILEYFQQNPGVNCIGGRVELYDSSDAAVSIRTSREFARYDLANFNPLCIPIIGCNMVLARRLVSDVGSFETLFGPGSYIGSGDDLDYIYRVLKSGTSIHYVPNIYVLHNHGRKRDSDISKVKRRYMVGRGAFYGKYLFTDSQARRWAYWETLSMLKHNWYRWLGDAESRMNCKYLLWLAWGLVKWFKRAR